MRKNVHLNIIILLMNAFLTKKIKGNFFEKEYLKRLRYIRDNEIRFESEIEGVLSDIWCDVDAFVFDAKLYDPDEGDIDEIELRRRVKLNLKKLKELIK